MAEDSDLEKTEPASSRRLQQAREEGQVPRSREIGAFFTLFVAALSFWMMGAWMTERLANLMKQGLTFGYEQLNESSFVLFRLGSQAESGLLLFAPLAAALVFAALASPFFMGSWNFTFKALAPDLMRMNPLSGLGRVISWTGLVELVKSVAKSLVVGGMGVFVLWSKRDEILALASMPLDSSLAAAGHLLVYSFVMLVLAMLLIVAVDVPFQLWHYHHKLKMTKEEVRQEGKELEGNPEVKGRIRRMQREAARKRMMAAIPKADVIVTNPTHYSVALTYKSGMGAPKVVAKGIDHLARKIREIGAESGVPILEAPPLARSLYRHVELDKEIPSALYAAVAEVLAYVFQLSNWRQKGGAYPTPPQTIEIPAEMNVEAING